MFVKKKMLRTNYNNDSNLNNLPKLVFLVDQYLVILDPDICLMLEVILLHQNWFLNMVFSAYVLVLHQPPSLHS